MNYVCNKCMKKYASTDGVRKHSRNKHLEWISFLKPKQYCTEIKSLFDSDELQKLLEPIINILTSIKIFDNDNDHKTIIDKIDYELGLNINIK